ncbi:MAG: prephenate dehydratase [Candidatus Binatia bacterium]|nr:MAG: prephenate dehydratase [Candidatus Binatia bacterium]
MRRPTSIEDLRARIDEIDQKLLALLNRRARLAREIGEHKRKQNAAVYAPAREKHILSRLLRANPGPLRPDQVRSIFREIISACLALEQPLKVAFLGPLGTFSHQAVVQQFGSQAHILPVGTIPEVFDEVEHDRADYGVVPVENSTEGVVAVTLDRLAESALTIKAELQLRVEHCLLARVSRLEDVQVVVAHPQALAQCRLWLQAHLPRVPQAEAPSTAAAAQRAQKERGVAAVASKLAAAYYDLQVLAENIQDLANNFTRFLVLGRDGVARPSGDDKTSIVISARHEAGALYRILQPFAEHGVSLCNIESRPLRNRPWEYLFFLDMVGHVDEPHVAKALAEVEHRSLFCKVLGSYPAAARPS